MEIRALVIINLSIKLGIVSVNSPRETYFMDALRKTIKINIEKFLLSLQGSYSFNVFDEQVLVI